MVKDSRRGGFTLIELTIAIVLLAIGLLALTGALARALHATAGARVAHAALREAESIADSLVLAGAVEAGRRAARGFSVEWRPAACGERSCMRIYAVTAGDTLSLLAQPVRSRGP
jgi:prepilin-type N-terminal cleavage/methylation domain-containing protein